MQERIMEKYIALLRGVNVGGKNKVSMPILKEALLKKGLLKVKTYINSGNVLFLSEEQNILLLQEKVKEVIFDTFALSITVCVISLPQLECAINNSPAWWGEEGEFKHNTIFIISPKTAQEVVEEVGIIKPEYEKVACVGQVVFWSAPIKTFSRTRWSKIASTTTYQHITIRNANTAKKLLQLVKDL